MDKPQNIDEYITEFSEDTQKILGEISKTIKKAAPDAQEEIAYGMPTFTLNGKNLAHFAAFKNHIGFYPTPVGIESFKEELSAYKQGKGSVQFPLDEPMPLDLIGRIVKFRTGEILEKIKTRKKS